MDMMTDVSRSNSGARMMAMPVPEFSPASNQVQPSATSFRCAGRKILFPFADNKFPASVDALPIGELGTLQNPQEKMIGMGRGPAFETFSDQFSPNLIWQQLATARVLKCADFRRECPSNTIYNTLNINEIRIC